MPRKRQTKVGRVSTMDVRSKSDVSGFESLLGKGPLTIVLVYADWCGHCQTFKQNMWNEVSAMPNKKVNTAAVHYDMVENTSLKNAKIEGYPSLLLVGTNKEPATFKENATTTNAMPTPQNVNELKNMVNTPIESPVSNANTVASNVVANATNTNTNSVNNNTNTVNTNTINTNTVNTNLNVSSLNNSNSQLPNMTNSMAKNVNSYVPADSETLEVPDTNLDIPKTTTALAKLETTNSVKRGGYQQGGSSLMSTLLKVTQEAAHAGALLLAANEYAGLAKRITRKYKKKSKKTKKNKQRR